MSYRNIWILAILTLLISGALMAASIYINDIQVSHNQAVYFMNNGWYISGNNGILDKSAAFDQTGYLKNESRLILTHDLPETVNKSLGFVTIGYQVQAFVDDNPVYSFGSSLDGQDTWGVKTHIFNIPDGKDNRELRLVFTTNNPENIAVSKHIFLDDATLIIRHLLNSDIIKICFALFYIAIGILVLIIALVAFSLNRFDFSHLLLALISLFIGGGILLNISIIAFYTGPVAVYWIVSIINLALPIPALLYLANERGFAKSRLLQIISVVQSLFLVLWMVCNWLNVNFFILDLHMCLFAAVTLIITYTLGRDMMLGTSLPAVSVSLVAILLSSVINAISYYNNGSHDLMDLSLIILALPVLVLMTGNLAVKSAQKEYRMLNESSTLRIMGDLLYKNYDKSERYIEETRQIWHDIDKHYSVISNLVGRGEYEELNHYLEHAGYSFAKAREVCFCENKLVNAILNGKLYEAENMGVNIKFTGSLPDKLYIKGTDLCSILVNMLDNAIEACAKMNDDFDKKIDVSVHMKNNFVYFAVANSFLDAPHIENDKFVTSKADKSEHGFGIAIVQKITRKYDGAFDAIVSDNHFLVRVALKNVSV